MERGIREKPQMSENGVNSLTTRFLCVGNEMINKVKTGNGKTYKARTIVFYFRDETGFERYIGRVALIGDGDSAYLFVPGKRNEYTKAFGEVKVVSKSEV